MPVTLCRLLSTRWAEAGMVWSNICTVQPHPIAAAASNDASSLMPNERMRQWGMAPSGEERFDGRLTTQPPSPLLPSRHKDDGDASAATWKSLSIQRLREASCLVPAEGTDASGCKGARANA